MIVKIAAILMLGLASALPSGATLAAPPVKRYVALGSSYAAGLGLGEAVEGAPKACMRGSESYPRILARQIGAVLSDRSCSGATADYILDASQAGLPPQIEGVTADTDLVTVTVGGNDLGYAGDMMRAAGWFGGLKGTLLPAGQRPYAKLKQDLIRTLIEVRQRAPQARVVLVTYPDVIPQGPICDKLGLTAQQANVFRQIAKQLAMISREAATQVEGTSVVDIAASSRGHDACSSVPWTTGGHPDTGFAFHPNALGAQAMAQAVREVL